MNIEEIIASVIPVNDYVHRNGFSNAHIIDKLNNIERALIEDILIEMLSNKKDLLIVETLAYLKSQKSLSTLYKLLDSETDYSAKIIIASSIFSINKDGNLLNLAVAAFQEMEKLKDSSFAFKISPMFYYLRKFKTENTDSIIRKYATHPDHLLSYNAKKTLKN